MISLSPLFEGARVRDDAGAGGPCSHAATDFLGANHGARFFRCQRCGAVLVRQEGRVWVVPPRMPAPSARERLMQPPEQLEQQLEQDQEHDGHFQEPHAPVARDVEHQLQRLAHPL
jgi:hypothetical protein